MLVGVPDGEGRAACTVLCVEPVFTVKPIPFEPLTYPVRTTSERLASVTLSCDPQAPPCPDDCDAQRCRIVLAAARREIDLLRRGVISEDRFEPGPREPDPPLDPNAAPPTTRMAYAPDPIGKPAELRSELPPDQPAAQTAPLYYVTNLGTLLDVLA